MKGGHTSTLDMHSKDLLITGSAVFHVTAQFSIVMSLFLSAWMIIITIILHRLIC